MGLALADSAAGTVDWSSTGTVVWTAGFAVMAIVGALMVLKTLPGKPERHPAPAEV